MPVAVIVDWYGPYTELRTFRQTVRSDFPKVKRALYMALGSYNIVRYIGLTETPVTRICSQHGSLEDDGNRRFYIGEIVTNGISGPRNRVGSPDLHLAERALIRHLQPELNIHFKGTEPEDCVSIFSRFYTPADFDTPHSPLPRFPTLVAYSSWSGDWYSG